VHYIPSLLVITLPPSGEVYSFILEVEGYPGQIFALASTIGLVWLRYKRPDLKRPFRAWSGAVVLRILLSSALLAAPFFPPKNRRAGGGIWYATYAVVGISVILFGLVYWYVWFKLLPRWKGYHVEEETNTLSDGTTVSTLVYVAN
jgi:amino acid transporter